MFNVKTRIAEDLEWTCDFEQSATGLLRKTGKLSGISMSVHGGGGGLLHVCTVVRESICRC